MGNNKAKTEGEFTPRSREGQYTRALKEIWAYVAEVEADSHSYDYEKGSQEDNPGSLSPKK